MESLSPKDCRVLVRLEPSYFLEADSFDDIDVVVIVDGGCDDGRGQ